MLRKLRLRQKIGFLMKKTCIMKMIVATTSKISDQIFSYQDIIAFTLLEKQKGQSSVLFLQETYSYKFRKGLSVNSKAFECLCVKVENNNSKNIVLNLIYRPPNSDHKELENYFKSFPSKREI